jgi:outer membrane protein OmpA-like peptidoglycan-associated protein
MKTALSLIVVAALAGCATQRAPEPATDGIGRYVFDYTVTGGKAAQLVQVFDDGTKTYVQFNGFAQLKPVIRTDTGAELPYERSGPYAVVTGVYGRLSVLVARSSADIVNNRLPAAASPAGPVASAPLSDKALPVIAAGVEAAKLLDLKETHAELSRVKAELEATRAKLAEEKQRLARLAEGRFIVRFADNSASVEIDGPTLEELSDLASQVQGLTVTGYTDAARLTPGGTRLALRRALAVRKLLQERGMDPAKIQIRYFGAGRFAVDNDTPEGKAENRRVEIHLGREASA